MSLTKTPDTLYLDSITIQDRIGTAGKLVIRGSAYVELCRFTLSSTPFGTPDRFTGAMAIASTPISGTVGATGTAALYTIETAFANGVGNTYIFTADSGTDVLTTTTANSFVNGQIVQVYTAAGTLPSPLVAATDYFVRDVSGYTLKLAATSGGSAIDLTTAGSGTLNIRNLVVSVGVCGANYLFTVNTGTEFFTATNHNFSNGDIVQTTTTGTLPAPLAVLTNYYVIGVSGSTFQLSTTLGGSAINLTTTGSGAHNVKNIATDLVIDSGAANPLTLTSGSFLAIGSFTHSPS